MTLEELIVDLRRSDLCSSDVALRLVGRVVTLSEALAFYAAKSTYKTNDEEYRDIFSDAGEKARLALKKYGKDVEI